MTVTTWGATPAQWFHFAKTLGLEDDLLPVVSRPDAAISSTSTMQDKGKTPSQYNFRREVVGIPKWTSWIATGKDIDRWQAEPDFGICCQTRSVRAIDIDIADERRAREVVTFIEGVLPYHFMPVRSRANSGKRLLAFRYDGELYKRVIPTETGIIEVLATGQQFVAVGTHPSGEPYRWEAGLPVDLPLLDDADLATLWDALVKRFHAPDKGEVRMARGRRLPTDGGGKWAGGDDPVADYLMANCEVHDVGADGQLFLDCPFKDEHTSDSGATSTAYFPANTGGYERGHWVCLHAHCNGREDAEFLERVGYGASQFEVLEDADTLDAMEPAADGSPGSAAERAPRVRDWPRLLRDDKGRIEPTGDNLTKGLLHDEFCGMRLAYDRFTDNITWAEPEEELGAEKWRVFADTDYMRARINLERRGFKQIGKDLLREAVAFAAWQNNHDVAQAWLGRLRWDGKSRVEHFLTRIMGVPDSPYARAVSRYIWTAHAGRVMEPGVKADMVPIYLGAQGAKKSTAIEAMAPVVGFYTKLDMSEDDDKLARLMRGKLVGELEELRGLNSRNSDSIKAWISRQREEWIPKYKEFGTEFPRRLLLHGTTNEEEEGFLADDTGERRWLPARVAVTRPDIDIGLLKRWRDQLWAEGADMFLMGGVDYAEAEELAKAEHHKFKVGDPWAVPIRRWLMSDEVADDGTVRRPVDRALTTHEVAAGALFMRSSDMDRKASMRIATVLKRLGMTMIGRSNDGNRYRMLGDVELQEIASSVEQPVGLANSQEIAE